MSGRIQRLAVINSHPIQYFSPLYRRIAQEGSIDLTVYYCSRQGVDEYLDPGFGQRVRWDIPLLEGYRSHFLRNLRRSGHVGGFASLINPGIIGEIARGGYDAVWLHGYNYATNFMTLAAASLVGTPTPILYRAEHSLTYDRRVRRSRFVRLLKPVLLRLLFRRISAFLAIGTLNREFYIHHGISPERIFNVPYTVDNAYFSAKVEGFRGERGRLRDDLKIGPRDIAFLFVAKMIAQKAPIALLEAYAAVPQPNKALLMVGDGELRAEAEAMVRTPDLRGVRFLGFVNQSDLPRLYAISDVFVRPDGVYVGDWGLTVNEAMAAGLPVIATDAIAAATDLIRDGVNGFVIPFGSLSELARAMSEMAGNPEECRAMGQRSREIISTWGYEECVQGLLAALNYVAGSPGRKNRPHFEHDGSSAKPSGRTRSEQGNSAFR